MKSVLRDNVYSVSMLLIILLGVLGGTILANLLYRCDMTWIQPFFMDQYLSSQLSSGQVKNLILHICIQRSLQTVAFFTLSVLFTGTGICYVFLGLYGCMWGLLASLEVIRMGIRGLLLAGAGILPQGICYAIPVYYLWMNRSQMLRKNFYAVFLSIPFGIILEIFIECKLLNLFLSM